MIPGFSPDHPSWTVLREEMEKRIAASGRALETPGLDMAGTEFARGQVAALRLLIADVQEVPVEPINSPGYE
jgi:hypothetical protein